MKVITDEKKIDEILTRGVITNVLPTKEDFKKLLMSGKRIRIYIGFDATADTLHLSHAKNIMLLEEFRKLGHEVILLFGDFTARIGDPSDQEGTRAILSKKEILNNIKKWRKQIKNLISFNDFKNPAKIKFNSKWLSKLSMEDVLNLASKVTVQQIIERDMFQKRIKEGKHIFLHEFMYPLMQGYDSVAMEVDVEMCGTDQIFNALVGRTLLRKMKSREKFVVVVNLMENPITKELMSKSRGTGVFLNTTPLEMFGAIMAQPDEMIEPLFRNCTGVPVETFNSFFKDPKLAKMKVAKEIVSGVFGDTQKAKKAEENWENVFSKKEIPNEMQEIFIANKENLVDVLVKNKILSSKSEWRRLIEGGGVHDLEKKEVIKDVNLKTEKDMILKIGKKKFVKIIIK
ncbi:MAG: tyrosine--tRNA ligase [Patescibacteria group bacterium]